jgi:hypothetical protein
VTQLLQQAIAEIQKLPEPEQDAIASRLIEELSDERRWQEKFAQTPEKLARLVREAREDIQAGRVVDMGIDEL